VIRRIVSFALDRPVLNHILFILVMVMAIFAYQKIPKEIFEDELIPLFEKCGKIWDMRLMMDPFSGLNRGYCFVTFCEKEAATEAVKQVSTDVYFL